MKNKNKYLIFVIIFLFYSCATDIPEDAFDYLAPPVITGVTEDDEYIIIQFTGSNNEYYFEGYNVYVSPTQMLRSSVASYKPVHVEGYASATPSFPLSPDDYNPGLTRTIKIKYYWIGDDPYIFENNITYWIMLGSYHKYLYVNEDGVSNQVSILFTK